MKNRFAIAATVAVLVLTIGALFATMVAVWPADEQPAAVSAQSQFSAAEIGQAKPSKVPTIVGPEQPAKDVNPSKEAKPPVRPQPIKKAAKRVTGKSRKYKPAVLQVVTNFEQADVKVNGLPYPEYYEPGEPEGMVLPAGGPYNVEVKFGSNTKLYNLHLRPHETRLLLVELSGYNSGTPAPPPKKAAPAKKEEPKKKEEKKDKEKESGGKITVYSKPAGTVIVDGKETGEATPGTVDMENGRHEVQVKYESGTVSEKKIVRVRNGSRIKLFFRERKN